MIELFYRGDKNKKSFKLKILETLTDRKVLLIERGRGT